LHWHIIEWALPGIYKIVIMRKAGYVMLFLGIVGVAVFGIQVLSNPENLAFFGIVIGRGIVGYIPLLLSALMLIVAVVILKLVKPSIK
jgi:hypothetical protein